MPYPAPRERPGVAPARIPPNRLPGGIPARPSRAAADDSTAARRGNPAARPRQPPLGRPPSPGTTFPSAWAVQPLPRTPGLPAPACGRPRAAHATPTPAPGPPSTIPAPAADRLRAPRGELRPCPKRRVARPPPDGRAHPRPSARQRHCATRAEPSVNDAQAHRLRALIRPPPPNATLSGAAWRPTAADRSARPRPPPRSPRQNLAPRTPGPAADRIHTPQPTIVAQATLSPNGAPPRRRRPATTPEPTRDHARVVGSQRYPYRTASTLGAHRRRLSADREETRAHPRPASPRRCPRQTSVRDPGKPPTADRPFERRCGRAQCASRWSDTPRPPPDRQTRPRPPVPAHPAAAPPPRPHPAVGRAPVSGTRPRAAARPADEQRASTPTTGQVALAPLHRPTGPRTAPHSRPAWQARPRRTPGGAPASGSTRARRHRAADHRGPVQVGAAAAAITRSLAASTSSLEHSNCFCRRHASARQRPEAQPHSRTPARRRAQPRASTAARARPPRSARTSARSPAAAANAPNASA